MVRKNHGEAFVMVYLVSLLCLPRWARASLPMGHPNFHQAAMIPIALVFSSSNSPIGDCGIHSSHGHYNRE